MRTSIRKITKSEKLVLYLWLMTDYYAADPHMYVNVISEVTNLQELGWMGTVPCETNEKYLIKRRLHMHIIQE